MAVQDGHSAQSFSPMALWFVPLQRFRPIMRPHFPLAKPMWYPGAKQLVQIVTGLLSFIRLAKRILSHPLVRWLALILFDFAGHPAQRQRQAERASW